MNKILITTAVMLATASIVMAQGYEYSEYFQTDMLPRSKDVDVEYVNCNTGRKSLVQAANCMRQDWYKGGYDNGYDHTLIKEKVTSTNGLYKKVAAGVAAQRPRRTSATGSAPTGHVKGKVGSYNYQTSDAHRQWMANRQAQIQVDRERKERLKREEEQRRKIADNNRAAAVTAATNARLQAETNRRIASDHWHANEGAQLVQQRARQAMVVQGPQFNKQPKMSAEYQAGLLRRQNKPRRQVYKPTYTRNTARRTLAQVHRTAQTDPARVAALQRALAVKAELEKRKRDAERLRMQQEKAKAENAPRMVAVNGKALVELGPTAHSTLGKDWKTETFTTPDIPSKKRRMTQEEYHRLIVIEMIDNRPLTPAEDEYYKDLLLPA